MQVPCTIMIEACLVWDSLVLITNTLWKKEKKNSFRKYLFIYFWYIEIWMKYQPTNWFGLCVCYLCKLFSCIQNNLPKNQSDAILKSESALFSKKFSFFFVILESIRGTTLKSEDETEEGMENDVKRKQKWKSKWKNDNKDERRKVNKNASARRRTT